MELKIKSTWPTLAWAGYIIVSAAFMRQVFNWLESWARLDGVATLLWCVFTILGGAFFIFLSRSRTSPFKILLIIAILGGGLYAVSRMELIVERWHIVQFSILGWLITRDNRRTESPWERLLVAAIFGLLVASLEEIFQLYLPNRVADVRDIITGTAGTIGGSALALLAQKDPPPETNGPKKVAVLPQVFYNTLRPVKEAAMKIKRTLIVVIILIVLALIGWLAVSGGLLGGSRSEAGFLRTSGRIEGTEYQAATKVAGKVTDYNIEEGQAVQAGAQIAVIDSLQLGALVFEARAYKRKAEANLTYAESELARYGQLLKDNVIAQQQYDEAKNRCQTAAEDVRAANAAIQKLDVDLADTKIVAPVSGVVATKVIQAGEVVSAGTPLITIINLDDLYLKTYLPTELAGQVALGAAAKIYPDALPKQAFDATVSKISEKAEFTPKNVETKSQRANLVFEVKLKVAGNPDHRLKPGMPAEALIRLDQDRAWPAPQ